MLICRKKEVNVKAARQCARHSRVAGSAMHSLRLEARVISTGLDQRAGRGLCQLAYVSGFRSKHNDCGGFRDRLESADVQGG